MEFYVKKFFALIIICLITLTCSLAGCATFSIDKVKYYNEVVAKVGDTNITRYELLSAYNNYGYNYYVTQQSMEEKEAINKTLDLLIDRELLFQYGLDNKDKFKPTSYQVNQSIQNIFDNTDQQFASLTSQAKTYFNIKTEKPEETVEEKDEATVYNFSKDYKYQKRAKLVKSEDQGEEDTYVIEYILEPEKELDVNDALIDIEIIEDYENKDIVQAIIDAYFPHLNEEYNYLGNDRDLVISKAKTIMIGNIIENQHYLRDSNGKPYSKESKDIIYNYFKDSFESEIKSIYLDNIRKDYLVNESRTFDLNELIEQYNYLVTLDKNKYTNHEKDYKEALKNIKTDADSILYHIKDWKDNKDDTKFGYFIHTLISFSEGQQTRITQLEKELNAKNITPEEYDKEYAKILASTTITYREKSTNEDGDIIYTDTENTKSFGNIMADYNSVNSLETFIDFMFKYTGDSSATLKQGMPYVVGNNGYSGMVEEFNAEALRLMKLGAGSMSDTITIDTDLVDLDAQNLCITTYGIHLLYYVGEVGSTDIEPEKAIISLDDSEFNLYTTELNPLSNKTYFDMLFDKVYPATSADENLTSNNGYTEFEENLADSLSHKVTKYTSKIKSTKTKI